jgi:hypothetical protein
MITDKVRPLLAEMSHGDVKGRTYPGSKDPIEVDKYTHRGPPNQSGKFQIEIKNQPVASHLDTVERNWLAAIAEKTRRRGRYGAAAVADLFHHRVSDLRLASATKNH